VRVATPNIWLSGAYLPTSLLTNNSEIRGVLHNGGVNKFKGGGNLACLGRETK